MSLTPGELRRFGLLVWLADQGPGNHDATAFYAGSVNAYSVSNEDAHELKDADLIRAHFAGGGSIHAELTAQGKDAVERFLRERSDKTARAWSCRSAAIRWLYGRDALPGSKHSVTWTGLADDPETANHLGSPFSTGEVEAAAAWLHSRDLIDGFSAMQSSGPIRAYLTTAGETCAEEHGCDTRAYLAAASRTGGTSVHVTGSGNQLAVGDHNRQSMKVGISAKELVLVIGALAELTREYAPDGEEFDQVCEAASAALEDPIPDLSAVHTFSTRVRGVANASGNAALAALVTLATNGVVTEAMHLTGHT